MSAEINWSGVFPAVTTQFTPDFAVDYQATHRVARTLVDDGVSGLIVCGTVGENCSLTRAEKVGVMEATRAAAGGRVPVVCGVAEYTTDFAREAAREGETLFRLARSRRFEELRPLYDWFIPLLHLDARPDLVQCIKLCEHLAGRGTYLTRPPRLPLDGAERDAVEAIMRKAMHTRPRLPDVGLPQ